MIWSLTVSFDSIQSVLLRRVLRTLVLKVGDTLGKYYTTTYGIRTCIPIACTNFQRIAYNQKLINRLKFFIIRTYLWRGIRCDFLFILLSYMYGIDILSI